MLKVEYVRVKYKCNKGFGNTEPVTVEATSTMTQVDNGKTTYFVGICRVCGLSHKLEAGDKPTPCKP